MAPQTLYEKIWNAHVVREVPGQPSLIYIDRHLIHEGTSPASLRRIESGRPQSPPPRSHLRRDGSFRLDQESLLPVLDADARGQFEALERNCRETGVRLFDMHSRNQGIVHIIGPELGITQPGQTIVCGDSHTSTHGAFGALAFGIGTSEVEHVLATQCLSQAKSKTGLIGFNGKRPKGVTSKDIILALIGKIGIAGGTGHVFEYAGDADSRALLEAPHDHVQYDHRRRRPRGHDRAGRDHVHISRRQALRPARKRISRRCGTLESSGLRSRRKIRPTSSISTLRSSRRKSPGAQIPAWLST